jgi:hypothetical protein
MRKRYLTPMHDSCPPPPPPPAMRGGIFHNLRSKNTKNHAISLLEMQGCPQSKRKKLNLFVSKISLKAIMNFLKTKKPKLKVLF